MGKCFFLPWLTCKVSSSSSNSSTSCSTEDAGRTIVRYSYKTLKNAAQGFQASHKIGEGGFGSVYKGKLDDGTVVAIKVLSAKSEQGEREFLAEIDTMKNARHQNLLRLRGFCVEGISRILVYDYMEMNSLAHTLLSGRRCNVSFTWPVRREICLGIARGLAYLHGQVQPHIVHRDIKPSNILLDGELTPKISDFGLAKLFPTGISHVSTRVAGTIGYLAPEYARLGKLTRKSDVYSFGVLLLEIINGGKSTNHALGLKENIAMKAWELYQANQLRNLVDPSILEESHEEELDQFMRIALLCVQETPNLRPTMPGVVEMLATKMDVRDLEIAQPGVITDLHSLMIRRTPIGERTRSRHSSVDSRTTSASTLKYSSGSSSQSSK